MTKEDEMTMVDGIYEMAEGDFYTLESLEEMNELWTAIEEAKDDEFVRPDDNFAF